jgi:prolyl oligopeptidase
MRLVSALRRRFPALTALAFLAFTMSRSSPANDADDPFLWLEDVTGARALDWVRGRNAESVASLAGSERFRTLETRIRAILDSKERIPFVSRIGDRYYNFWRDAANPKGLWRRTTLEEYRRAEPAWETVLDLDALAEKEGENWVWHGAAVLEPEDRLCLVSLSRGGADADVVREFDLERKAFVDGGFSLPEAKSRFGWRNRDSLFVATDFGPGSLTASGYPRTVREWSRGTPLSAAAVVYEGRHDDMSVAGFHDPTPGFERDLVRRQITFWTNELFLRRDGRLAKVEKPDDADAAVHREWLLIELRSPWTVGGTTHPAGALLAADFERFLAGDRGFHVLFAPGPRTSLAGYSSTRNHLLLSTLDNVRSRVDVLTFRDGRWHREPLPGVPEFGTASATPVDDLDSDDYLLVTANALTPSTLSLGSAAEATRPPEKLKQSPAFFSANGLRVSQHEATSRDGTRVPYFQIGPEQLPLDGSTPTLLYGYGGFEIPLVPGYEPIAGACWLEQRHVHVIANIRGGGEFGPRWHQAALKEKRPRAYEDFIAVAEDLVARKVTSPAHLGVKGGSNGGLLVGNMLTMRPDLFGAVVCQVPLLDMRRYHTLLAGASWMGEYGDPDDPAQWSFIRGFSPYHNVDRGREYPPTLITTSTRDDRVHPGHARKMTARLLELGKPVLYYENIEGGHGGAADNRQRAFMDALGYAFLDRELR